MSSMYSGRHHSLRRRLADLFLVLILMVEVAGLASFLIIQHQRQNGEFSVMANSVIDEPLHSKTVAPPESVNLMPVVTSHHDTAIPPVDDGLAPVVSRLSTQQKVVFLGIDDGQNQQPFELQMMKDNGVKASLFLTYKFIKNNPAFFQAFTVAGSLIEDHTLNHRLLPNLSYAEQKREICGAADLYQQIYGRRPILFRPPGGSYDLDTRKAVADCGMRAVVLWIAKANGGAMQYQYGHGLRPGDIVLMHFRPEFRQDMQAFLDAQNTAGLHTELLEDWLQ